MSGLSRREADRGLLEKWNKELLDENKALKEKVGKGSLVKNAPGARTLSECESIIQEGVKAHVEAWFALKEIHDRTLYKPKYEDFKAYCQDRWGYRQEGYRYLRAAEVTQRLLHEKMPPPPSTAHALALAPLFDNPEKMADAWGEALELNDGHPTFLEVKDVVAGFLPPKSEDTHTQERAMTGSSVEPEPREPVTSPSGDNSVGVPPDADFGMNEILPPTELPVTLPNAGALGPTPRVGIAPEGEYVERRMLTPEELGPIPQGYYTREQVLEYHNRFNGIVRSASKYLDDPAIKTWFVSLYRFCQQVMETENLL